MMNSIMKNEWILKKSDLYSFGEFSYTTWKKEPFTYIKSDHGQFCSCWFSVISGLGYTSVMQNVKIFSQSSLWNRFFSESSLYGNSRK